jgi:hypothetical protein
MEDEVSPFNPKKLHTQFQCSSGAISYYFILKIHIVTGVICDIAVVSK